MMCRLGLQAYSLSQSIGGKAQVPRWSERSKIKPDNGDVSAMPRQLEPDAMVTIESNPVAIEADIIIGETATAYLLSTATSQVWLPKSIVHYEVSLKVATMPYWLARDKKPDMTALGPCSALLNACWEVDICRQTLFCRIQFENPLTSRGT